MKHSGPRLRSQPMHAYTKTNSHVIMQALECTDSRREYSVMEHLQNNISDDGNDSDMTLALLGR